MGQKGMRAMSPLQAATANDLRVKLGRGRDLPEEARPKRAPKTKPAVDEAGAPVAKVPKQKSADGTAGPKVIRKKTAVSTETEEVQLPQPTEEIKPAATLFRHAASAPVAEPEPTPVAPPAPVIAPPPAAVAPPPVVTPPAVPPVAPPSVAPPRVTPPPVVRREPTVLRPTPPPPVPVQPRPVVVPPAAAAPAAPPAPPKRVAPGAPTPARQAAPPMPARPAATTAPARPAAPAPAAVAPPLKVEVKPEPSKPAVPEPPEEIKRELVKLPESVTVGELAAAMRHKSGEVIKALLELGVMATVNEVLDPTAAK